MRVRMTLPLAVAAACSFASAIPSFAALTLPRPSPNATVKQTIGVSDFTLTYSRPGVKNRTIWGDLVPYDKPWRTGANEATTLVTTDEMMFGGVKVPAGTYSLYTVPAQGEWVVVLNSAKIQWGATTDIDSTKNVARVKVKPTSGEPHEWLEFAFEDLTNNSANLVLHWEKLELAVPITVETNAKALANARVAIAEAKPDDWSTPYQAASFTFNNDVSTDEGWKWLEKSIAVQPTYQNQNLLARWHYKAGRKKEAIAAAEKAIAAGKASKETVDVAPTEKLLAEWKAK